MSHYGIYEKNIVNRLWEYRRTSFPDENLFESHRPRCPPVFHSNEVPKNILIKPELPGIISEEFLKGIPRNRHRWLSSMKSSQALTLSIFMNLWFFKKLDCLRSLKGDDGKPIFIRGSNCQDSFSLEFNVKYLGEHKSTSLDVFFGGEYRVSVECKFTEKKIGPCSRPEIKPNKSNYQRDHCDGRYAFQHNRYNRCSLSSRGVRYWQYIPELFNWSDDVDYDQCPLLESYQLVRNILAACVRTDGELDPSNGHAVLVYDERNPVFQPGGKGWEVWHNVKSALKDSSLLQACSWQKLLNAIRFEPELSWLIDSLQKKYGL